MPRRALLLGAGSLVLFLGVAAAWWLHEPARDVRKQPPSALTPEMRAASHRRMLDELEAIRRRTPDESPFLGDRLAREMRRSLALLGPHGDPKKRWQVLRMLSTCELRLGNERAAIEHGEAAYGLLPTLAATMPEMHAVDTVFQLGIAYMRFGETENCCQRNHPDSCLLPIRGGGVHTRPQGASSASRYFTEVLQRTGGQHLRARWLLNIAAMTLGTYPESVPLPYRIPPERFASEEAFPSFPNVAAELGVGTFNLLGGAVADDFDNDGDIDLMISNWDTDGPLRLFRNRGDGRFDDVSEAAGLAGLYGGINMVQGDYDNDGNVDVFVLRGAWADAAGMHPDSLLRNNGDGTFTDVTFAAGLGAVALPSHSAAWADYDNDGHLDLYVGNEHSPTVDAPGQLFRNRGDGTFVDVAARAGVENRRFAKGVVWGDYDDDGDPDLYVSNMQDQNRLYRNEGDGRFTDVAPELGVTRPIDSFPVWFWDFDNDGVLDIYVGTYLGAPPGTEKVAASYLGLPHDAELAALYRGDGSAGFRDVAAERGLGRLSLAMGANLGDLDNDGYLDFYLGTGYPDYESLMPNVMYRNSGGERFVDVTTGGGFGHLQKGHGIAFADFDGDGDQDVFAEMGGAFPGDAAYNAYYRNPGFGRHWIALELVGTRSNRSAIGARIRVDVEEAGGMRSIHRHVTSGGSFGANPLRQSIGLGAAATVRRIEVRWPSGLTQIFRDPPADRVLQLVEGEARPSRVGPA